MTNLPVPSEGTAVVGVPLTAAFWNTNVRDAINFLLNPPMCEAYQTSATTTLPAGTWTPIGCDTNTVDSYGGHNTSTNNSRYVGPVPGWYQANGIVAFTTGASTYNQARIAKNGNPYQRSRATGTPSTGAFNPIANPGPVQIFLNGTGDYIEIHGIMQAAGATAISLNDVTSGMSIRWVHA